VLFFGEDFIFFLDFLKNFLDSQYVLTTGEFQIKIPGEVLSQMENAVGSNSVSSLTPNSDSVSNSTPNSNTNSSVMNENEIREGEGVKENESKIEKEKVEEKGKCETVKEE
jgi:hypothetical protein